MHSELLYDFCILKNHEITLNMLKRYDDIDILYMDGAIIRSVISLDQVDLVRAALDYFEHKQFPVKDKRYEEARDKLIEILEEYSDGMDYRSEMSKLISEYIGSDNDVGLLRDVCEENELAALDYNVDKYGVKATHTAHKRSISLESLRDAAKAGDSELIAQNLNVSDHNSLTIVVSEAVHAKKYAVLSTVINMAGESTQKSMILGNIGDVYSECELFDQAIEYYTRSLDVHPNCYITHSKIGAAYHLWLLHVNDPSQLESPITSDPKLLLKNAIENYNLALKSPDISSHNQLKQKLSIASSQLEHIGFNDTQNLEIAESLISCISDEEADHSSAHQGLQHSITTLGEVFAN